MVSVSSETVSSALQSKPSWALLFVLISFASIAVLGWSGISSLPVAWQKEEYSHGWLIPPIAIYLFLRRLERIPDTLQAGSRLPGLLLVLFALAFVVLGNMVNIADVATYGLIIWVYGAILVVMGIKRGFSMWIPVVYLAFMLPLPNFIYWQLSIALQLWSSELGVQMIMLFGVPVFLDGNVIDLGIYKLQVAEACSGLRYLFPLASFGFLFAALYQGPVWHKVLLFLITAPITVLMNSIRIGGIGILVDNFGIEQAEGFLHTFEGWVIFISCLAILFGLSVLLQRTTKKPKPIAEALDLEMPDMQGTLRHASGMQATGSLIAMALVTALTAGWWEIKPQRAAVQVDHAPMALFPLKLEGGWQGNSSYLSADIEQVLGADDYFYGNYVNPAEAAPVDFFMAWYRSQTEGSGIHSPEVCIPVGGWEVSSWEPSTMQANGQSWQANRAIIQKGLRRQLVYYWFEQRGRRMTSDYEAKLYTVLDSARHGRTDGGLVRLITPINQGETVEAAEARLLRFLEEVNPKLDAYYPPL